MEQEFPKPQYYIVKSHTYPYSTYPCDRCKHKYPTLEFPKSGTLEVAELLGGADFEIAHDKERIIIVEVKTTMHESFKISGSKNRKYLEKQINDNKTRYPKAKMFVLYISLAIFPKIVYRLEEKVNPNL